MRLLKYFLVSCLLTMAFGTFVNVAFAVDYYWYLQSYVPSPNSFPDPETACQSADFGSRSQSYVTTFDRVEMISTTSYRCWYNEVAVSGGTTVFNRNLTNTTRAGSTCPEGSTYNATTGLCDVPEPAGCEALASTSQPFSKSGTAPDDYADLVTVSGKVFGIPNTEGCINGCAASTADQKCTITVEGAYSCAGTAWFSGQVCSTTGTGDELAPEETAQEPEPQTTFTDVPCTYETQPDGTQLCRSEHTQETEGQHCGTVNGKPKCVSSAPSKDSTEITTTVDSQTNPDGSTTTTKTDTATKTSCSGVNSCTSTTTTTTTVTNKGTNGETTSSTSSCTGENCAKDAGDDQDGDGMDDCQIGGDCDGDFTAPEREGDEPPGFGDAASAFMDRLGASPLLSSVTAISVPGGGSCNFPEANTPIGTISMDSMCDLASTLDGLHAVFLAVWGLAAIRVFMSA